MTRSRTVYRAQLLIQRFIKRTLAYLIIVNHVGLSIAQATDRTIFIELVPAALLSTASSSPNLKIWSQTKDQQQIVTLFDNQLGQTAGDQSLILKPITNSPDTYELSYNHEGNHFTLLLHKDGNIEVCQLHTNDHINLTTFNTITMLADLPMQSYGLALFARHIINNGHISVTDAFYAASKNGFSNNGWLVGRSLQVNAGQATIFNKGYLQSRDDLQLEARSIQMLQPEGCYNTEELVTATKATFISPDNFSADFPLTAFNELFIRSNALAPYQLFSAHYKATLAADTLDLNNCEIKSPRIILWSLNGPLNIPGGQIVFANKKLSVIAPHVMNSGQLKSGNLIRINVDEALINKNLIASTYLSISNEQPKWLKAFFPDSRITQPLPALILNDGGQILVDDSAAFIAEIIENRAGQIAVCGDALLAGHAFKNTRLALIARELNDAGEEGRGRLVNIHHVQQKLNEHDPDDQTAQFEVGGVATFDTPLVFNIGSSIKVDEAVYDHSHLPIALNDTALAAATAANVLTVITSLPKEKKDTLNHILTDTGVPLPTLALCLELNELCLPGFSLIRIPGLQMTYDVVPDLEAPAGFYSLNRALFQEYLEKGTRKGKKHGIRRTSKRHAYEIWKNNTTTIDQSSFFAKQMGLNSPAPVYNTAEMEASQLHLNAPGFTNTSFYDTNKGEPDYIPEAIIPLLDCLVPPQTASLFDYLPPFSNYFMITSAYCPYQFKLGILHTLDILGDLQTLNNRILGDDHYLASCMINGLLAKTKRAYLTRDFPTDTADMYSQLLTNYLTFRLNHPTLGLMTDPQAVHSQIELPLLWLHLATVKNEDDEDEQALVPTLLLPSKTQQQMRHRPGAEVRADWAEFKLKGDFVNKDFIEIKDLFDVVCQNFINIQEQTTRSQFIKRYKKWGRSKSQEVTYLTPAGGGVIEMGRGNIRAEEDILNEGGTIIAVNDLDLYAGHDVKVETIVDQDVVTWKVGSLGKLKGNKGYAISTKYVPGKVHSQDGVIHIVAGNHAENLASLITAGKDVIVEAKKLIETKATSTTFTKNHHAGFRGLRIREKKTCEIVIQRATTASENGNLTFIAHNGDISHTGATTMAALKVTMTAKGGTVSIQPLVVQTKEFFSEVSGKGFGIEASRTTYDKTEVAQPIVSGQDIEINADLDVNIRGTLLSAIQELAINTGGDIDISSEIIEHFTNTKAFSVQLQFFGSAAIQALIAKDCKAAAHALLHEFPALGAMDDLAHSKDTADITANSMRSLYHGYKALQNMDQSLKNMAAATQSLDDLQKFLDPKVRFGASFSKEKWTEALQTFIFARRILLNAKKNVTIKGAKIKGTDLSIDAGEDITLTSTKTAHKSENKSGGISVSLQTPYIPGADYSQSNSSSTRHIHTHADLDGTANLRAGATLKVKGAVANADIINVEANKLKVASVQDTHKSAHFGASIAPNMTGASVSGGRENAKQVKTISALEARRKFTGDIASKTLIKGGIINAPEGWLNTPKLVHQDIHSKDKGVHASASVSDLIGIYDSNGQRTTAKQRGSISGFVDVNGFAHDRREVNRAVIGHGIKITTDSDISSLERDPTKAHAVTKNKKIHVRVAMPLVRDFKALGQELEALGQRLHRGTLTEDNVQAQQDLLQDHADKRQLLTLIEELNIADEGQKQELFLKGEKLISKAKVLKALDEHQSGVNLLDLQPAPGPQQELEIIQAKRLPTEGELWFREKALATAEYAKAFNEFTAETKQAIRDNENYKNIVKPFLDKVAKPVFKQAGKLVVAAAGIVDEATGRYVSTCVHDLQQDFSEFARVYHATYGQTITERFYEIGREATGLNNEQLNEIFKATGTMSLIIPAGQTVGHAAIGGAKKVAQITAADLIKHEAASASGAIEGRILEKYMGAADQLDMPMGANRNRPGLLQGAVPTAANDYALMMRKTGTTDITPMTFIEHNTAPHPVLETHGFGGAHSQRPVGRQHQKPTLPSSEPIGNYEEASYHHRNSKGPKSPAPKNGQKALDNSIPYGAEGHRIGIDDNVKEIVVLMQHRPCVFHGHVRSWQDLKPDMQKALIKAGKVRAIGNGQKVKF